MFKPRKTPVAPPKPKRTLGQRIVRSIRNNTLVGLFLVTPIAVTGFIVNMLFRFTTNFLPRPLRESEQAPLFRVLALLAVLLVLFFIGLLVRNMLGRKLYQVGDRLLTRIPIINKIYIAVRQISESILAQRETIFNEVVLVEYPRRGLFSLGFVTAPVPPNIEQTLQQQGQPEITHVAIFIPTTPNPTSGLFILADRREVITLPLSITDAMKLVVSGGAVFPDGSVAGRQPSLLDKLDHFWR